MWMCICTLIGVSLTQEGICERWGKKSPSTALGGSVSQQVSPIVKECCQATEQTDPYVFDLHS